MGKAILKINSAKQPVEQATARKKNTARDDN